jgi:menaquinone-dependent protoporphyrinogen oxidase
MHVLVAYASRHGATQGIAERIALALRATGLDVEVRRASSVKNLAEYDAFVIGSATYMFHWLKDAVEFVRRNRTALAGKPVWLFSSGPLGTEATDAKGRDQKVAAVPKEVAALAEAINARDHRVFFGAYERDRKPIGIAERFVALMPATQEGLPQGDFRDWPEIDGWAAWVARDLELAVRESTDANAS